MMRTHILFLLISLPFTLSSILLNSSLSSKYESFFSFGDSLSDTGNLLANIDNFFPSDEYSISRPIFAIDKPPYGETYFHKPTGRCSDGRLIVDFIGEALGISELPLYLASDQNGYQENSRGVNFAVAGATALDTTIYYENGLDALLFTNFSLNVQLGWFKKFKDSTCNKRKDCAKLLGKSLFLLGEIGGNDYSYQFFLGQTIEDVRKYVPKVISVIVNAAKDLIEEGAVNVIVPGNYPLGCVPMYLSYLKSSNKRDYDPHNKCLVHYNRFMEYHNKLLKSALSNLGRLYPHANIIYADYYTIAMRFFNSPERFGFKSDESSACCGGGDLYNFNISAVCGQPGSKSCGDPSSYVNWDGIHLTEAAYQLIAKELIRSL